MPDDSGVISTLRARRPKRQAPVPRTGDRLPATPPQVTLAAAEPIAARTSPQVTLAPAEPIAPRTPADVGTTSRESGASQRASEHPSSPLPAPLGASPDEPTVNFAVRVRKSFDELLSIRLGELRARGVRSSKVEITEMLLAELAGAHAGDIEQRLAVFRRNAPR